MGKLQTLTKIVTDRRWWGFYLQRRIANPSRRGRIADRLAQRRPKALIGDEVQASRDAASLENSGLIRLGTMLDATQCNELVDHFSARTVHDPYRASAPKFLPLSEDRPAGAHIAHHEAQDILDAPHLIDLANNARILDAVGHHLGCKPTIGYMAAWWSYPTGLAPQHAENFHRDVDDWRFVKLFVYLTEVSSKSGPHKYVVGSSSDPRFTKIGRYGDAEIEAAFAPDKIVEMTATAGEAFLEDTYGLHKGQPVEQGHRLLFQVMYTMSETPYAPKSPPRARSISEAHYDQWTNRLYLK